MVRQIDLTDEALIGTQSSGTDRAIMSAILGIYREKGYAVKIRTQWKAKNDVSPDAYRVFCYIGKSKESLIMNTRSYDESCFMLQIKIWNRSTLERLDDFTDNIRNQILNAKTDCRNCGCPDKAYVFAYGGNVYRKCHMLCDNFRLSHFTDGDIASILEIVTSEIDR